MDFIDHIWYSDVRGDEMIIDIRGIELTPGNNGEDCKGNGNHLDAYGNLIESCCDECDYLLCCISESVNCSKCTDNSCPRRFEY